jgi:hypothetical protein
MRTWVWFLTACCKTERGPWLISCSSNARSWASSSSDFGTWTYWLTREAISEFQALMEASHLIMKLDDEQEMSRSHSMYTQI